MVVGRVPKELFRFECEDVRLYRMDRFGETDSYLLKIDADDESFRTDLVRRVL